MTVFFLIILLHINNNKVTYKEIVGFFLFINLAIYLLGTHEAMFHYGTTNTDLYCQIFVHNRLYKTYTKVAFEK